MNDTQTFGRYRVIEELGRGGMAIVYTAEDPMIGRRVALKVVQRFDQFPGMNSEELQARFEREVRSAGVLTHPNIIQVYDVGTEGDCWWFAMELAGGDSLEKKLARAERLTPDKVLHWGRNLADALDYSHRHGVVHRDVKPANILMTATGVPMISYFGIARVADTNLTQAGKILGTPAYMSPEQAAGKSVEGASDQFSLAVVLYHAMTGKKPFQGETPTAVLLQIVKEDPPPPSRVNSDLPTTTDAVFERALAKQPEDRYPTCLEFIEDLEAATEPLATTRELGSAEEDSTEGPDPDDTDSTAAYAGRETEAVSGARFGDVSSGKTDGASSRKPAVATIVATVLGAVVALTVAYFVFTGGPQTTSGNDGTAAESGITGPAAATPDESADVSAGSDAELPEPTPMDLTDPGVAEEATPPSTEEAGGGDAAEPATLEVQIASEPPGARVTFDGSEIGTAPVTVPVAADAQHQVSVSAEGYEPMSWAFSIQDLSESQREDGLFFPLEPSTPPARVRVDAGYPVSLEATPTGGGPTTTAGPGSDAALSLSPGEYRLELSAPEVFFRRTQTVNLESEQELEVPTPAVVEITVAATPGNCRVEIDGRYVDVTPIRVSLVEGEHEFRFEWPSLDESVTRTETISPSNARIFATVPR